MKIFPLFNRFINVHSILTAVSTLSSIFVFHAIVPLTFMLGYYADLAYGSKLHRITGLLTLPLIFGIQFHLQNDYAFYEFDVDLILDLKFDEIHFFCCTFSWSWYDNAKWARVAGVAVWVADRIEHRSSSCWKWNGKKIASIVTIKTPFRTILQNKIYTERFVFISNCNVHRV